MTHRAAIHLKIASLVFAQTFIVFSRFGVAANFPKSFLIADEVGLGKTLETGLIFRYLLISQKVKPVLILAPASIQLKEKSRSLLLLSATPMQINTIEVFDLLQLVGLRGHWFYGKNFCNYFST